MTLWRAAHLLGAALLLASCGGSASPAAPSAPTQSTSGAASACAAISSFAIAPSLAIVNGASCSTDNSPVVLLNMRDKSGGAIAACSGTVVAPRAVLTAAHCLGGGTALVKIYRGSGLQVDSVSFNAYPGYQESDPSALDVGVVLTGEDLQRPAVALLGARDARVGEQAIVAGWGLDQNDVGTTLRAGFTTVSQVGSTFLQTQFANGGAGGICSGDSGGPLLVSESGTWTIAGITSALSGTGCVSGTAFFANVRNPDILSFIRAEVPQAALK